MSHGSSPQPVPQASKAERPLPAGFANSKAGHSAATHFRQAATSAVESDSKYNATTFGRHQTLSNAHKYIYRLYGYAPPE